MWLGLSYTGIGSYTSTPAANLLRIITTLMNGFQIQNFVAGHFGMFNQKIIQKGLGPLACPCIQLLQCSKHRIPKSDTFIIPQYLLYCFSLGIGGLALLDLEIAPRGFLLQSQGVTRSTFSHIGFRFVSDYFYNRLEYSDSECQLVQYHTYD